MKTEAETEWLRIRNQEKSSYFLADLGRKQ